MDDIEAIRSQYRPTRITTLFVGESAPASGAFFYKGDTSMARNMKAAIESAGLGGSGNFLDDFKARGWYLDDLVLTPINKRTQAQKKVEHRVAKPRLALRIAEYRPLAIVSLLYAIADIVKAAADKAGLDTPFYRVPFPGNGQQKRFKAEMARILPMLPRLPG